MHLPGKYAFTLFMMMLIGVVERFMDVWAGLGTLCRPLGSWQWTSTYSTFVIWFYSMCCLVSSYGLFDMVALIALTCWSFFHLPWFQFLSWVICSLDGDIFTHINMLFFCDQIEGYWIFQAILWDRLPLYSVRVESLLCSKVWSNQ